jgi:hydroxymethylpyrimidine pyrophosphatase-like HAD family hydrolase
MFSDPYPSLRAFLAESEFMRHGGVMTDLDGTAVHDENGRACVSAAMEGGLLRMHELGRAVIINSLRFPRSVIEDFGEAWYRLSGRPVPVVSLRGSLCGRLVKTPSGGIGYEEIEATVLDPEELRKVVANADALTAAGLNELLIFFYPRDWTRGEVIWTPDLSRHSIVAEKYRNRHVISGDAAALERALFAEEICMVFRLLDLPQDHAMAYQHTEGSSFYTHAGVDKHYGARRIAEHLGIDLLHSIGAGDTPMDDFLSGVGFAVIVGTGDLDYHGRLHTVRLRDPRELGNLLCAIRELTGIVRNTS